ncbi:MAG: HGGxSTG domain-containing protein [Bradyrhizobium sp.]
MSDHVRNTGPMLASPRCGARTRAGGSCRSPAVRGKRRCRMHGGAPGCGAQKGNQNARRHGLFTKAATAERKQIQALLGEARRLLQVMK